MIKLLLGGSPCTYWSIAKTSGRETEPCGTGWELFRNYITLQTGQKIHRGEKIMKMYVLQVKSGYETSACRELRKQRFDAVLPLVQEYIIQGRKWSIHEKIIFTQYLFIRFEPNEYDYYKIRKIDGVVRFLGYNQPLNRNILNGLKTAESRLNRPKFMLLRTATK